MDDRFDLRNKIFLIETTSQEWPESTPPLWLKTLIGLNRFWLKKNVFWKIFGIKYKT